MNIVVSASLEHGGLRRRRSSSECLELPNVSPWRGITKKDLGVLKIGRTGETITDPQKMYFCLKREIARLSEMQEREAKYIKDLREEITGFARPFMRALNVCVSGVEPEIMLAAFEEQQLVIIEKLKILKIVHGRVELYLLEQKKK